ncbi:ADP-ribose pyrophosphatase [Ignavibacterium album JCM 16511]|uniref:ADP-ribose pyrophosphatase n=1 Tax=Ignavibacterium album (strain DSM 19864 / JCM 16511 / NBRC 101810 / Mat9-16) TaxID=945713 RepID=I0AP58_IGNAJ|nr:NUDIX hydrolase [Ignavibacterium album]AFH50765.1 ADP-ribose pyrophosphatase [Ignavibacterium album JCM 16511]
MEKNLETFKWLEIAREIQQLSQTGLAFATNEYEKKRYTRLTEIVSEIIENQTQLEKESVHKYLMNHPGYATPKIDVRAAVIKDNQILLVQESTDKCWAMPGGWADVGDIPSQVAIRETKEESGFDVIPKKVIGVFDANRLGGHLELFHAFKIIFLCDLIGGKPQTSDETLDVKFFHLENLPPLSLNRTNEKHIEEIKLHLLDKNRPTYFD